MQAAPGSRVEYHHFEVAHRIRCTVEGISAPVCDTTDAPIPSTPIGVAALFERPRWDDYTQLWLLSGSDSDDTDVSLTSALFETFLEQTRGSCVPVLIGAGDGFITHGNAVAKEMGIGEPLSSDRVSPGFFSVSGNPPITVDTRMFGGQELDVHPLFEGVHSVADTVSTWGEGTHGDIVAEGAEAYQVIAHDTAGRPSIAVGSTTEPSGGRPFVIDAGFQRFYGMKAHEGTWTYLRNVVGYLGSVGCKAEPTK